MADFLKKLDGDFLLLQTQDKILLSEQSDAIAAVLPLFTVQLSALSSSGTLDVTAFAMTGQLTGSTSTPVAGSGLYWLEPNKRHDRYYSTLVPPTEVDIKIP